MVNTLQDGATGDGIGRLFVLDAASGTLIRAISTGVGDVASPSGLAKITAQVVNPASDNTVEAVYGGDLLGNLWRFDINDTVGGAADANAGYDAQLLAILKDGAGIAQPITTKPEVGLIPKVNVKVVYVGTGRFLAADDASDTSQQSFYAIKDVRAADTTPSTAIFNNPRSRADFIRQVQTEIECPAGTAKNICDETLVPKPKVRSSTTNPVDFALDSGWFFDLITSSERANTDPALALGLLAFNTNVPSLAACDVGGTSYQYFIDYLTGGAIQSPGTNGIVGRFLANELASGLSLVMTKSGKLLAISGLSGGGIDVGEPPLPSPASLTRRTSWRELIRGN